MPLAVNPFTPTFGRIPPVLAGREVMLNNILQALDQGSGNPNLCTIFIGPRGTGKTALMSYLAREATGLGWISADVSALPGMLDDIIERSTEAADDFIERQDRARVKSISVGQLFGVEWEYRDSASGNWRTRMNHLLNKLAENNIGLLITVDEVRADLDEMIQFASVFQHFVREERKVALLMAGLPANVSSLVSDKRTSFLRRAAQEHLGAIGDYEVAAALRQTIVDAGRSIDDTALEEATAAIDGFPYMMQLVGFRAWNMTPQQESITLEDVKTGVMLAQDDFEHGVLAETYKELSDGDRAFLSAMLPDEKSSTINDIATRMGQSDGYARVYRGRLLKQGLIVEEDRGRVSFGLPFLRDFIEKKQR